MKNKLISLILAVVLCLSLTATAFAATVTTATIDPARKASLTLIKYDFTSASEDGVLRLDSYVSTGKRNPTAENTLSQYAIPDVTFTYVKIADIVQHSAQETDGYKVMPLYRFAENEQTTALLAALGLTKANAYTGMDFNGETLQAALNGKLAENASGIKDALETFAKSYGSAMPATDRNGRSSVANLEQGLYLLVETKVPQNVSCTTAPFFVSLPMTTIDGSEWNYDVVVYPKNETDEPTLDKTLRESKEDGGKHTGSGAITDGYAHSGTASIGDTIEYQFVSTLPRITSGATYLTAYSFKDTLSAGLTYNKNDVKLTWYKDASCTEQISQWDEASGKFTVTYGTSGDASTMSITMTETGLTEINTAETVYGAESQYSGYSGCTVRVTYAATVDGDAKLGDLSNDNGVDLEWHRTSDDTVDMRPFSHTHLYTYGVDLAKLFSDKEGNFGLDGDFSKVEFLLYNETDGCFETGELKNGIYYVNGHTAEEETATRFIPTAEGKLIIRGLEDDGYRLTEIHTDSDYKLLESAISVVITAEETDETCRMCGEKKRSATATVNGDAVTMTADGESASAFVPLTVVNLHIEEIPATGDSARLTLYIGGAAMILSALGITALLVLRKKKSV